MARSRSFRSYRLPLEDQVQAYRPVGDAILVRSDEGGGGDQFPTIGASAVDPSVQPALHPLLRVAEDHHLIEVFPLHDLAPATANPSTQNGVAHALRGDRPARCRRFRGPSG